MEQLYESTCQYCDEPIISTHKKRKYHGKQRIPGTCANLASLAMTKENKKKDFRKTKIEKDKASYSRVLLESSGYY